MNINSLRRIEDVITPSGRWDFLEVAKDTIYLDFCNVELGNPKSGLSLSIRFAQDSFISFFYDNIWDLEFLADFNHKDMMIETSTDFKINKIRFLDFEYLDYIINHYNKNKSISVEDDFDISNIRTDFFLIFETDDVAIVVGGNQLDFFCGSEKIDDYSLKELSNQWMLYFLDYKSKRNILNKDSMCEIHINDNDSF